MKEGRGKGEWEGIEKGKEWRGKGGRGLDEGKGNLFH